VVNRHLDALTYAGNPMNLADLEAEAGDRCSFCSRRHPGQGLLDKLFAENAFDGVFSFWRGIPLDRSILGAGGVRVLGIWR